MPNFLVLLCAILMPVAAARFAVFISDRELGAGRLTRRLALHEGLGAAVGLAAFTLGASPVTAGSLAAVAILCAAVAEIDREIEIVPDPLVLALAAIALLMPFTHDPVASAWGAVFLGAVFTAAREIHFQMRHEEGIGLGDVKLALAMGGLLGAEAALLATAAAAIVTAAWIMARRQVVAEGGAIIAMNGAPFAVGLSIATIAAACLRVSGVS